MGFSLQGWADFILSRARLVGASVPLLLCFDAHVEFGCWFGSFKLWFKTVCWRTRCFLRVLGLLVSLACAKPPFCGDEGRVIRVVFPRTDRGFFRVFRFFRLNARLHYFVTWDVTESFSIVFIVNCKVSSRARDPVSLVFFRDNGAAQNRLLLSDWGIHGFVHPRPRSNEPSLVIFKPLSLTDAIFIKVLLGQSMGWIISICSWELFSLG